MLDELLCGICTLDDIPPMWDGSSLEVDFGRTGLESETIGLSGGGLELVELINLGMLSWSKRGLFGEISFLSRLDTMTDVGTHDWRSCGGRPGDWCVGP